MLEELKNQVCRANKDLMNEGLVVLTWGNVSGIDRPSGLIVIKPSGVSYGDLQPSQMVVVDIAGRVVEGELNPSSDTPTHLTLYRAFPQIGGVTHTHSTYATMFAQAARGIPCLGTTHADHFFGSVPVTRPLPQDEVQRDYETNTGKVIVERFADLEALEMPAVLVANHGPFAWGSDAVDSVTNALALEHVARMAMGTLQIAPDVDSIAAHLLEKHYLRKHGANVTYGQK